MTTSPEVRFLDRTTPPHIITLVLLAGVSALNMSVFLPSLPEMTEYFQTDYAVMQLSVSGYLATTAVLQLVLGPLSDRFGRRPVVLTSLAIFIFATLGCILAPTAELFLLFRMISAAVASGIALSRAVIRDIYPMNESASVIGYVTMGMALVPMVAPMVGGAMDTLFGWQSVFVLMIVCGAAVWWLLWRDLGETLVSTGASFLDQVRDYPELFASPRFWGYALAAAFASGCFFAFLGGAPYASTNIFGLSALATGIGFGAPPVGYAIGNYLSGRYSARVGINTMMLGGAIAATSSMVVLLLMGLAGIHGPVAFFGLCTGIGIGNGLVIPNATAGLLSVRPHLAGTASGIGGAIMVGGGAALSVLAGVVIQDSASSLPLVALICASAALCLTSVMFVIRREQRLALHPCE